MEQSEDRFTSPAGRTALYCMANIMRHLGGKVLGAELAERYGLLDEAATWDQMRRIAKAYKYKTELIRPSEAELREVPTPAIVRFKNGVFAIMGVNNDEAVFIFDPSQPKPVALPRRTFLDVWTGEVLVFTSRFDWQNFCRKYNLKWFYSVIVHYKRYFAEAAAASFFLQLMGLAMPLFTQVVIDKVIGNDGLSTLTVLGVAMAVFCIFQSILGGLRTYVLTHTTNKLDAILGARLFRQLISLPLPYYEHRRVGDTLMRVGALTSVREFLTGRSLTTLLDVFFSLIFIAVMFCYSVPLTLIALSVVPLYLAQNILAMPVFRRKLEAVWRAGAANKAFLVEAITGIHTVKALAIEPQFKHRWEGLLGRYIRATFDTAAFNLLIGSGSQAIQRVATLGILWYGGHMVMSGQLTLGQLIAFQMISAQALQPLTNTLGMWQAVQQVALSLERLGDILNTRMEPVLRPPSPNLPPVSGEIVLKDVTFRYRLDTPLVLRGVNLHVRAGEKIGIVGRSGSGKSTLTSIIQKLYIPESGVVLVDGVDIATAEHSWLRKNIGVVMQENYLFNASIRDNIAAARPTATMDEVIRVAKMAGAHEFILELSEGYDTKVGERGASLSGGQRQRVAIARALLDDPPILIFDEATSALDYEAERVIMKNLAVIAGRRTLLMIAHRLTTVEKCDRIVVVDDGVIVEVGAHAELLALGGVYQKLYRQQEV